MIDRRISEASDSKPLEIFPSVGFDSLVDNIAFKEFIVMEEELCSREIKEPEDLSIL